MPEAPEAPAQAPAAPAAAAPNAAAAAASVESAAKTAQAKITQTTQAARAKLKNSVPFFQKWLRTEDPGDAENSPIYKTPLLIVNDAIDAIPLNIGRRAMETIVGISKPIDATLSVAAMPFSPIESMKHPIKSGAKIVRTLTASTNFLSESINLSTRLVDDFTNRGIKRILQRVGHKTPLVGGLLTKGGSAIGWLTNQPRKITEWFSEKTLAADNYMASKAA